MNEFRNVSALGFTTTNCKEWKRRGSDLDHQDAENNGILMTILGCRLRSLVIRLFAVFDFIRSFS